MAQTIRVGIIGLGWGVSVHLPALRAVPGYEVAALCGSRADRTAAVAARLGVPESSGDWQSFVRRDDLDLIVVASPPNLHYPMVMAAVEAGKHVLCEKPLAMNAGEGRTMAEAAEQAGVVNAIGFEKRWYPEAAAASRVVRDGGVGALRIAQISNVGGMWHPSQPPAAPWKAGLAAGGGYINAVACHEIDYLCWLFGAPVAVCAEVATQVRRRAAPGGGEVTVDADDTVIILLRFPGGGVGAVSGSAVAAQGTGYRFEVCGSEGTISYEMKGDEADGYIARLGGARITLRDEIAAEPQRHSEVEGPAGFPPSAGILGRSQLATAAFFRDWLPAFSGAATPVPTLRQGYLVQQITDAARQSGTGAGWVTLQRGVLAS